MSNPCDKCMDEETGFPVEELCDGCTEELLEDTKLAYEKGMDLLLGAQSCLKRAGLDTASFIPFIEKLINQAERKGIV